MGFGDFELCTCSCSVTVWALVSHADSLPWLARPRKLCHMSFHINVHSLCGLHHKSDSDSTTVQHTRSSVTYRRSMLKALLHVDRAKTHSPLGLPWVAGRAVLQLAALLFCYLPLTLWPRPCCELVAELSTLPCNAELRSLQALSADSLCPALLPASCLPPRCGTL